MTAKQVIDELRKLMARCTDSEYALYDTLIDESEGWHMRLEELKGEEDDG